MVTTETALFLDIVTPDRLAFSGEVKSVSAPGTNGSFSILNRHTDIISSLKIGEVKIVTADDQEVFFSISGGFLENRQNRIILLAETAERSEEIDLERAEASRKRAEERLASKKADIDDMRARAALMRSINRIKVYSRTN